MLLKFPAWKIALVLATLLVGLILCLPNILPSQYTGWVPTGPLKLGLDLKGGASILLEVDPNELRSNQLKLLSTSVRDELRRQPLIAVLPESRRLDPAPPAMATRLLVKPSNPADAQTAIERIQKLGDPPLGTIGGQNSLNVVSLPDGTIEVTFKEDAFRKKQVDALASSMEAVRRRIDNSGLTEPNVQKLGDSRILVEVPGLDASKLNTLVDTLTQAGVLTFNMVDVNAVAANYTPGEPRNGRIALPNDGDLDGQPQVIFEDPVIVGADLSGASQTVDDRNRPAISFQLHAPGARKFGKATSENVGRPFAIVLDNRIVSAPNIQSPIMTGNGIITGSFTPEEAEQMAIVLRSGALPAKLKVVDQRVVDPSLGADSIRAGVTASIVGVTLVAIFMILAYGLLGVFAVMALLCNMFMMIGVLSGFGATLTLPGIAGILLTMGMAVDYNVLIFERIREEKRAGRSPVTSVEAGYDHAMTTIIDANVTHLIAALIMFNLGSGPVRGFALTLAIGVLTSIFTAVIVARLIMANWLKIFRPKWIPI